MDQEHIDISVKDILEIIDFVKEKCYQREPSASRFNSTLQDVENRLKSLENSVNAGASVANELAGPTFSPNGYKIQVLQRVLFFNAKYGIADGLEKVLQLGVDINSTDEYSHTALHLAVLQDKSRAFQSENTERKLEEMEKVVRFLITKGANVDALTKNDLTALHYAVNFGYANVVATLLEFNADVHREVQAYMKHAGTGECFCASDQFSLLESMRGISKSNETSWVEPLTTILHTAVIKQFPEIVYMLLRKGAEVDAVQFDGKTPLMVGSETCENDCEILQTLINFGANVNFKSNTGLTPLHCAAEKNREKSVELLLAHRALVDEHDFNGRTPIYIASEKGFDAIVELLLKYGADIDQKNNAGRSLLHIACEQGQANVVEVLLRGGADLNIFCENRLTPYEVAVRTVANCRTKHCNAYIGSFCDTLRGTNRRVPFSLYCGHTKAVKILHLLQGHIKTMDFLDLYVSPLNRFSTLSKLPEFDKNIEYAYAFKKTVIRVKGITVGNLFQMKDPTHFSNISVLMEIDNALKNLNCPYMKENITNVVNYAVRKAKLKIHLLNEGQDWLVDIFKTRDTRLPPLPTEMYRHILSYLNNEEIKTILGIP